MIGKSTSAKIANMSIVCVFLVVCIHVAQGVEVALGTSSWWIRKFIAVACAFGRWFACRVGGAGRNGQSA